MKRNISTTQTGYALILMVLTLMGIGGVLLTGFTQDVKRQSEHQRYLHNQRVLKEAKQALLQYAYNYPVTAGNGPGRLPCPDTNNDGIPNASAFCINGAPMVGRFPWKEPEMNFYDARDASGERLWYAVSSTFANSGGGIVINSGTVGQITIQDQSGAVMYDGTATGVAAVIIAPGLPIDRGGVAQDRPADVDDPVNYLDLFGAVDNADFVNNSANGFIMGPIDNLANGIILVNDQLIVVTTAEVIAMAEKATLQAYRDAIDDYLLPVAQGGVGGVYPWLYNYDVATIADLNGSFPADSNFVTETANELDNFGRVPSMFDAYFSEVDSEQIESKIGVEILNADFMGGITYNRTFPAASAGTYTFVNTIWNGDLTNDGPANMNMNVETNEPVTGLRFDDDGNSGDNQVKLIGSIAADETYTLGDPIWFWSRNDLGSTEWAKCRTNHIVDCHVDAGYIPDPHGTGQRSIQILRVEVELTFDSGFADAVEFTFDVTNLVGAPVNPVIAPADVNGHAQISATFTAAEMATPVLQIRYELDDDYTDDGFLTVVESGTLDFSSFVGPTLELGLRFYPELPDWVYDNGWHNAVMMAYADDYRPDGAGGPCTVGTNCLVIDKFTGARNNKVALLVIAGEHDWDDDGADGMSNDVGDVFDVGNDDLDSTFDVRAAGGNDKILVIDEI
jgi:hypothetical protein